MKSYGVKNEKVKPIVDPTDDDDELEDLDDDTVSVSDDDDDEYIDDDSLYDSSGRKVEISKPMWTSAEKTKQKPAKNNNNENDGRLSWQKMPSRMSTGEWLLTLTFMCIPIVNIVLLFIWAFFSDSVQDEKKNYARANIIIICILTIVIMFIGVSFKGFNLSFSQLKSNTEQLSDQAKKSMKDQTKKEAQDAVGDYSGLTDENFTD